MTMRSSGLLAIAALCTTPGLCAVTVEPFNELRLSVSTETSDVDSTLTLTSGSGSISLDPFDIDEFDSAWHIEAGWIGNQGLGSSGGLLYGLGLLHKHAEIEDHDDFDLVYTATGLRAHLGWGYAFTTNLQLEILPFLGIAATTAELSLGTYDDDWDGLYVDAGTDVNLIYTATNGLSIGGGVGFLSSSGSFEDDFSGIDAEYELEQTVGTASLYVGMRF